MSDFFVKHADNFNWKVVNKVLVKTNGNWVEVREVYAKENGAWEKIWPPVGEPLRDDVGNLVSPPVEDPNAVGEFR